MYVLTNQSTFCDLTHKYVLYLQSYISIYICVQRFINWCYIVTEDSVQQIKWDAHHCVVFSHWCAEL